MIKKITIILVSMSLLLSAVGSSCAVDNVKPLKVLLVTGGGYHDYEVQKYLLTKGMESRANIDVTVSHTVTEFKTELVEKFDGYQGNNWADGYDVVVHDICSAKSEAEQFVDRVANVHRNGVPAVFLHCALFSYRDVETDEWWKLVGISVCPRHEKHHPISAANNDPNHPILKDFPYIWLTPKGELYKACKVWPTAQIVSWGMAGEKILQPVVWTNKYGLGRIVSITIGHHNETVATDVYLDLVTRAVLWAGDKLDEDSNPKAGYSLLDKMTALD